MEIDYRSMIIGRLGLVTTFQSFYVFAEEFFGRNFIGEMRWDVVESLWPFTLDGDSILERHASVLITSPFSTSTLDNLLGSFADLGYFPCLPQCCLQWKMISFSAPSAFFFPSSQVEGHFRRENYSGAIPPGLQLFDFCCAALIDETQTEISMIIQDFTQWYHRPCSRPEICKEQIQNRILMKSSIQK